MISSTIKNTQIKIKEYLICLLFSLHIFFWGIDYNFVRPKFFIFLLFFFIIFNLNKIILLKLFKYSLISLIVFLHLFFQAETFFFNYLFFTLGLFLIFTILDVYQKFFFKNLNKIIYIFLIFFFLFIIFHLFFQYISLKQVNNICIGCFSLYKIFFKENSHLAIIAPSVIFYLLFISTHNKVNSSILIIFIIICFINKTLTLYVGLTFLVTLTIFFKMKKNNFQKIILILITFLTILNLSIDKTAKIKLADGIKIMSYGEPDILVKPKDIIEHNKKRNNLKKINLSMEVYKTSLIITKNALLHKPFGYGFNNYNEAFDHFIQNIDVYNWETRGLNTKDGSNTFVKIVVEFGIFSLFFFYFLISFFLSNKIDNRIKIFLILPILIQLFIRGVGYFNGGFLFFSFYALLLWLKAIPRNNL